MDTYSVSGDLYQQGYAEVSHQGYSQAPQQGYAQATQQGYAQGPAPHQGFVQASDPHQGYAQVPPVGATPVQAPPPAQSTAPVSTPLAPPGVVPSPPPAPVGYYGTYPNYADTWNAYPTPAYPMPAEPLPHISYPPYSYTYSAYGHHPHYQETFPYINGHHGHRQEFMRPPRPGSDVTHFRKRRHLLTGQNPQWKGPLPADSRAFISSYRPIPMASNAHPQHSFQQRRVNEAPASTFGKKRKFGEPGDRRPASNDARKEGVKSMRRNWYKSNRKNGRKPKSEASDLDSNADGEGTRSGEKHEDVKCEGTGPDDKHEFRECEGIPLTEEQVQEAATWLELHKEARKRVQEFLHSCDKEVSMSTAKESNNGVTQGAEGGALTAVSQGTQDALVDGQCGGVNADADEKLDTTMVADGMDYRAEQTKAICADGLPPINQPPIDQDETGEQQSVMLLVEQEQSPELLHHLPWLDDATLKDCTPVLSGAVPSDIASPSKSPDIHNAKFTREDAQQLVSEVSRDLKPTGVREPVLSVQAVDEVKEQNPLNESANNEQDVERKHQKSSEEGEPKDLEEKSFEFFTKLLEENVALRKLYVEKCNDGAFECLMCQSKMKRFTSIASLVSHANNVLKTKRLPEHRGYGHAVCCLFGWDPCKIPSVPIKSTLSRPVVHVAPPNIETVGVVSSGSISAQAENFVNEHTLSNAVQSVFVADVESAPISRAISHTSEHGELGREPDMITAQVDNDACAAANTFIEQVPSCDHEACIVPNMEIDGCLDDISKDASMKGRNEGMDEGRIEVLAAAAADANSFDR